MSYVLERVHTDPRLRRRRKAVERSRRRKMFTRLAVLVALLVLVWAVLWSPLLAVRHLELHGVRHTTPQEVLDVTALGDGTNILRLSTDRVRDRIETLPWVKSASVARVLPGTLRIRITEREPALVLALGAAHWIVDKSGRVLAPGKKEGLPVLAGADVDGVRIGLDIATDQLVGGLRVYRSLSRSVQHDVAAIFAPTPERITLALVDGSQVRYGPAEMLKAKSSVLKSLLHRLERDGTTASYIDLRVPSNPAVSPAADPDVDATTTATTATIATTTAAEADGAAEVSPDDPTAETTITDGAEDADAAGAEATGAD